jgi:alkylation response protein AidB-like acyl-CoA dehydrogenase
MDFNFTEEQKMIVDGAKKFAEKELAPAVEELDAKRSTWPRSRNWGSWAI